MNARPFLGALKAVHASLSSATSKELCLSWKTIVAKQKKWQFVPKCKYKTSTLAVCAVTNELL